MSLPTVISQRTYPGVGDVDDCTVIATFWAALAAGFRGTLPSVAAFRSAAGRPDAPGSTGLTLDGISKGISGTILGTLGRTRTSDWAAFMALLRAGGAATLMVKSSLLPAPLGYMGLHQVGIGEDGGLLRIANPLAANGSAPVLITEAALKRAALGTGSLQAIVFARVPGAGRFSVDGQPFFRYRLLAGIVIRRETVSGRHFTADTTPRLARRWPGHGSVSLARITTGAYAGWWVGTANSSTWKET